MFNESFEKWCINQGYVKLAPSPLIRNDNHLFTFSPFEDLENNYLKEKRFKGFKVQDCFRNVFPQNLVNPLCRSWSASMIFRFPTAWVN